MDDLTLLEAILAKLYSDPGSLNRVLMGAGIDTSRVEQSDKAIVAWHNALVEAAAQGRVPSIIQIARTEYPNNTELIEAARVWHGVIGTMQPTDVMVRLGHTIERVDRLEREVRRIWRFIIPPPRRRVALALCAVTLIAWWTSVVSLYPWYLANPAQGAIINAAFPLVAALFLWLAQEDRDDAEHP